MQIDWLTVTAQMVNFLILVYLLQRFLYAPVVNAMTTRERGIVERIEQAQAREREASEASKAFHDRQAELQASRETMLEEARAQAQGERQELLEQARADIAELRKKWRQELSREQEQLSGELRLELAQAAVGIARHVLVDLAQAKLEEAVIEAFFARIESMDEPESRTLWRSQDPLEVSSVFALDHAARARITKRLHALFGSARGVHYQQVPELICGIELASGDHKVAWTVVQHLHEIEGAMRERLAGATAET